MKRTRRARRPPLNPTPAADPASAANPALARIVEMLSSSRSVRTELVEDVRAQFADRTYLTDEKLNLAIYRMLRDILR